MWSAHSLRVRFRAWLDDWVIQSGSRDSGGIARGVEKSRTLVMCMSPDYFESEWGKLEHHSMLFRDPTNAKRRFLPLLIKQCKTPDIIAQFAHIDWRTKSKADYEELLVECRHYLALRHPNIVRSSARRSIRPRWSPSLWRAARCAR